jgi:hypothetical protein
MHLKRFINFLEKGARFMLKKMFCLLAVVCATSMSFGALNVNDPGLIVLYQFNEGTPGNTFTNGVFGSFVDTAVTGTPQNHDDASSFPSPMWGGGADYAGIGDGVGLTFDRAAGTVVRALPWQSISQGNYNPGGSYTEFFRVYSNNFAATNTYRLYGTSSNRIQLVSPEDHQAVIDLQIREGAGGSETKWNYATDDVLTMNDGKWYNLFVMYNANTSITVALDDGTTFQSVTTLDVPSSFDTLSFGMSDGSQDPKIGSWYNAADPGNAWGGRIESCAVWDRALTLSEAQAIGFTNVPEPVSMLLFGVGAVLMSRKRK